MSEEPYFIKKHYLLSLVLLFTPIHEFGHVVICWCTGVTIVEIDWWDHVTYYTTNRDFIQTIWEYSAFITLGFVILFIICNWKRLKQIKVRHE